MRSYGPLEGHLRRQLKDTCSITFSELEKLLGFALPMTAMIHRSWWSNEMDPKHTQNEAWRNAGWEVCDVDVDKQCVNFKRTVAQKKPRFQGATQVLRRERDPAHRDRCKPVERK